MIQVDISCHESNVMMTLKDRFGREIGNVRISLTDRCNLRCQYCMPEEGIKWLEKSEILSFEEILRLVNIFYKEGVRKFRITGGEPLVRNEMVNLLSRMKSNHPDIDLAITTNGLKLTEMAKSLKEAGVDRLNISLDTLDHDKFSEITRRDKLDNVMRGIQTAIELGFNVKINAVSIKSFNDDLDTLLKFVDFSEKYRVEVRFIEMMPFTGNNWKEEGFVPSNKLRELLRTEETLVQLPVKNTSSTSKSWSLRDGNATIGFISSVSESFCDSCNRVRITSEGKLRPCLHNAREYDLKQAMRSNKSDNDILEIIKTGLNEKWKEHPDFLALNYKNPVEDREMIRIGG